MTVRELRKEFEKALNRKGVPAEVGIVDGKDNIPLLMVECFEMSDLNRRKILQTADGLSLRLFYDADTSLYFSIPKKITMEMELDEVDNAGLFYDGFN